MWEWKQTEICTQEVWKLVRVNVHLLAMVRLLRRHGAAGCQGKDLYRAVAAAETDIGRHGMHDKSWWTGGTRLKKQENTENTAELGCANHSLSYAIYKTCSKTHTICFFFHAVYMKLTDLWKTNAVYHVCLKFNIIYSPCSSTADRESVNCRETEGCPSICTLNMRGP